MLLTSSQVSLAISSFIVFFFATALFLAGYVLQQQTVRDLRAAIQPQLIRPPPSGPQLYLPPQFRDKEYWEAKGVVDAMLKAQQRAAAEVRDGGGLMDENVEGGEDKEDDMMIGATRWQKKKAKEARERRKKAMSGSEGEQKMRAADTDTQNVGAVAGGQTKIPSKEEYLSPAERRKKIKAQIIAEGEGESFKGYRRRMW